MADFHSNLATCHRCLIRADAFRCNGVCPCVVDGRDIAEHAALDLCPRGHYRCRGLGDLVARVLNRTGIARLAKRAIADLRQVNRWLLPDGAESEPDCSCEARRVAMNKAVPFGRPSKVV
ncbi:hypothetical protein [Humisphaera borealis]|uniref:Uncharacterized protein n=1 Tax=Humisphaera borealis TaxID=2807512 RepID=A0A7M2WZL2_9BACT|nr:hypothetical protein [Humisphaera borealis]QOV90879.1 hypothetical protein IPV69_05835 [Humisphaera borealis]